jgi:hypothetical protein
MAGFVNLINDPDSRTAIIAIIASLITSIVNGLFTQIQNERDLKTQQLNHFHEVQLGKEKRRHSILDEQYVQIEMGFSHFAREVFHIRQAILHMEQRKDDPLTQELAESLVKRDIEHNDLEFAYYARVESLENAELNKSLAEMSNAFDKLVALYDLEANAIIAKVGGRFIPLPLNKKREVQFRDLPKICGDFYKAGGKFLNILNKIRIEQSRINVGD